MQNELGVFLPELGSGLVAIAVKELKCGLACPAAVRGFTGLPELVLEPGEHVEAARTGTIGSRSTLAALPEVAVKELDQGLARATARQGFRE